MRRGARRFVLNPALEDTLESRRLLQFRVANAIGRLSWKRRRCQQPGTGRKIKELHHVVGIGVAQC